MLKNSKAQMVILLAAGLLAGYAAARKLNPIEIAVDAQAASALDRQDSMSSPMFRGSGVGDKEPILLAAHNNAIQHKSAESGKKSRTPAH